MFPDLLEPDRISSQREDENQGEEKEKTMKSYKKRTEKEKKEESIAG